ncbi:MAG: AAA family ATPase [Acidimicrobiaceae bacterium]|nr:AAA family ATPase [Acidimicrobiaceae bacterium]
MAHLQPENLASRSDVPERLHEVARHLRDQLPDEVTVWLERTGDGEGAALQREFDGGVAADDDSDSYLVVLDPQAGLAVLQAPSRRQIKASRRRRMRLDEDAARRIVAERVARLAGGVANCPVDTLPVEHILALPQTFREHTRDVNSELPLLVREDFEPGALRIALQRLLGGQVLSLGVVEETHVRTVVHPEIVIRSRTGAMFGATEMDGTDIVRALDREQERTAHHLGSGYRVLRGVAGSGKTLVLTHRALYMASHFRTWRFLLLCFNRPLAAALRAQVADTPNIDVQTLDQLAYRLLKNADRIDASERSPDFDQRRRDATALAQAKSSDERYDMVLVDEAQDLGADGLELAWAMLKPGRDHFVMALDGAQRIYRGKRRWNPPGLTAQGRTKIFDVNYRNTGEVLEAALLALGDAVRRGNSGEQGDDLDVFVMPEHAARRGPAPVMLACGSMGAEVDEIVKEVARLRDNGVAPEHIAVLSGWPDLRREVLRRLSDAVEVKGSQRDTVADASGIVPVATLQMLKGLEYRHVIIGGANSIWVGDDEPAEQDRQRRRLLYVAMTRASESLRVTYSDSGIMDAISQLPELHPSAAIPTAE